MNPAYILLTLSALLGTAFFASAQDRSNAADTSPAKVFLFDDESGEELSRDHGIEPITTADLAVLIDGVVSTQREVVILHELIDEDAADNQMRSLALQPYSGEAPPTKPSATLPLRQLVEETERYRAKQAEWREGILEYRAQLLQSVEGFVREITLAQLDLAGRIDEILRSRNGRDFNRSDVSGSILSAGRSLGRKGLRLLVINSDAVDLPGTEIGRQPRHVSFTPEELDPGIVLVWVNTSGVPQQAPAFDGLPNPSHHVSSMAEAMALVRQLLGSSADDENEPVGDLPETQSER